MAVALARSTTLQGHLTHQISSCGLQAIVLGWKVDYESMEGRKDGRKEGHIRATFPWLPSHQYRQRGADLDENDAGHSTSRSTGESLHLFAPLCPRTAS